MRGRYRLLVWIAIADFFTVFSVATFAVYTTQRIRMKQADNVINVDRQVRNLAEAVAKRLRYYGISAKDPGADMAIELPEVTLFEDSKWEINDQSNLEKIAHALQDVQQQWNKNFMLVVRGHADSRPPSDTAPYRSNLQLSEWRAQTVETSLASRGIRPPQFQIVAEGVGESEPVLANCRGGALIRCTSNRDYKDADQLKRNRRIELRFGVFSGNLPTVIP